MVVAGFAEVAENDCVGAGFAPGDTVAEGTNVADEVENHVAEKGIVAQTLLGSVGCRKSVGRPQSILAGHKLHGWVSAESELSGAEEPAGAA